MGKRSDLTVTQRREAVLMLIRREEPAAKLARRFGVSEHTLYRWRDDFLAGGEAALASGKVCRRPGYRDKTATQKKADELERQAELRRAGHYDPYEEHANRLSQSGEDVEYEFSR